MALNKLRGELKAVGVTQNEAAELLGMTASNFNRKLAEAVPFTRDEMFALRDRYFPETSLDYLFQSDGDKPTKSESLHAQIQAMGDAMRDSVDAPDEREIQELEDAFHECVNEWEHQESDERKPAV